MNVLKGLRPNRVFYFFEEICKLPHGSRHTSLIADYLTSFACEKNLIHWKDQHNNVVILKDGSPGYSDSEPVILQGHIDMVCEKSPESAFDFANDGLKLRVNGDYISADDTTLGADNGIAVAMMLAILESPTLPHPPIEAVFTSDEEIGLIGAGAMDVSRLKGRRLINIDSEEEGFFTVSCAGGFTFSTEIEVNRIQKEGLCLELSVSGLQGGHSGIEIHKLRGNGNILMGRLLMKLSQVIDFNVEKLWGGQKDNAICKLSTATIITDESCLNAVRDTVLQMESELRYEYKNSDSNINISLKEQGIYRRSVVDDSGLKKILNYLFIIPDGVQNMSLEIPDLVETSLNLGILKLSENHLRAVQAGRSSVESRLEFLKNKLASIGSALGGTVDCYGQYPGWEYKPDSPLRQICVKAFKEQYGRDPEIIAVHAGLECGLFVGKIGSDLDCISLGPDMDGVHTVDERLCISSTERTWELLLRILKACR